MELQIRFANETDLPQCSVLDRHIGLDLLRRKIEWSEIIVAYSGDTLVGYLRLEYLWSAIPYIALIFLPREYRGQGIGRAVLGFLEDYLRASGHELLMSSSQVNEPAPQAWHRAVGFEECGILSGINEGAIGEVFFRKRLL